MDFQRKDERNIVIWLAAVVPLITFLVYLPALNNDFVNWDDGSYVYENLNIRSLGLDFIKWSLFNASVGHWLPVTWFSLALDYAMWGLNPFGFHLTNIILHSINALLVFILAVNLIKERQKDKPLTSTFHSLTHVISASIAALLFGIHPIHVESVAWITERKDVLSLFFFLTTVLFYLRYNSASGSIKKVYYGLILLLFILSLMAKPMTITLPIVLLILDFYPLRRIEKSYAWLIVEKIPFFMLSLIASLINIWTASLTDTITKNFSFMTTLFIAARGYMFYIAKMIIPVNLAPLYPYPSKADIFTFEYLGSAVILFLITLFCLWSLRRGRLILSVWMYYIVTLIPVIGIVHLGPQDTADRFTYLPSIGPFLLTGLGIGYLVERYSKKTYPITLIAIFMLFFGIAATKTVNQIAIWQNSITLWTHELKVYPEGIFTAYLNRGIAYDKSGNYQQALNDYNAAIKINPFHEKSYLNRGGLYANLGDLQSAILDYNKAEGLNPRNAVVYYNRGNAFRRLGNNQLAIKDYDKAIEVDPQYVDAYYNRGNAYSSLGDFRRAIRDFDRAIELNTGLMGAYSNRGIAYNGLGDYRKAISDLDQAIRLNPKSAEAYNSRGLSYEKLGDYQQAIQNYKTATEVNPQFATAYYNLSIVYELIGDIEQSRYYYNIAMSMRSEKQ